MLEAYLAGACGEPAETSPHNIVLMFLLPPAGIDWLVGKFKAYMLLRERLLSDTSILRDKLDVAQPDLSNGASGTNGMPQPLFTVHSN